MNRDEIAPLLRRWSPRIESVTEVPYGTMRGPTGWFLRVFGDAPVLRNMPPTIVRVRTATS